MYELVFHVNIYVGRQANRYTSKPNIFLKKMDQTGQKFPKKHSGWWPAVSGSQPSADEKHGHGQQPIGVATTH